MRVRALDERGKPILVEASGLEARVIQHEMDHLDGVLILDRTSRDQRKQAMRALRERSSPARLQLEQRLPRHHGVRGGRAAAARRLRRTARSSSSPAPTPSRGAARSSRRRPSRCSRASSGSSSSSPRTCTRRSVLAQIAAAQPEVLTTCAFGVLIKEPLLSDYEMINVHPSLLPRWRGAAPIERAIMAGDAETGVAIMRVTAGWDSGAVYALGARADRRPTTTTARSPPRLETLGADLLVEVARRAPDAGRAGRVAGHLREQDRPARARAGPDADAGGGRAHDPRAAPAHRLPAAAARRHASSA